MPSYQPSLPASASTFYSTTSKATKSTSSKTTTTTWIYRCLVQLAPPTFSFLLIVVDCVFQSQCDLCKGPKSNYHWRIGHLCLFFLFLACCSFVLQSLPVCVFHFFNQFNSFKPPSFSSLVDQTLLSVKIQSQCFFSFFSLFFLLFLLLHLFNLLVDCHHFPSELVQIIKSQQPKMSKSYHFCLFVAHQNKLLLLSCPCFFFTSSYSFVGLSSCRQMKFSHFLCFLFIFLQFNPILSFNLLHFFLSHSNSF